MAKAGTAVADIRAKNTTATATVIPEVVEIHASTQENTAEAGDREGHQEAQHLA